MASANHLAVVGRKSAAAALSVALICLAVVPARSVLAATFTFNLTVFDYYASGSGPASTLHTITLYAPTGEIAEVVNLMSDASGSWSTQLQTPVLVFSKVKVQAAGDTRTVTVPRLTANVDRVANTIGGKAPAGKTVSVNLYHYPTLNAGNAVYATKTATADANGNWLADMNSLLDISGNDYFIANLNVGTDWFYRTGSAPYVEVTRASPQVMQVLNPSNSSTVKLLSAANAVKATAFAKWDLDHRGGLYATFFNGNGDPVTVQTGDKFFATFATDTTHSVPFITVSGNAATDVASGHCMANAYYSLYIRRSNYSNSTTRYGATDGSGNFSLSMPGFNLSTGDRMMLTCRYLSGDRIKRYGTI